MSSKPRYWDTAKGQVLYAIYRSQNRTWNEIQEITRFRNLKLRKVLKSLSDSGTISKKGDSYWIEDYDLYIEYRNYDQTTLNLSPKIEKIEAEIQAIIDRQKTIIEYLQKNHPDNNVITRILYWTINHEIPYNPYSEQFFVEGDNLDQVSKTAIEQTTEAVLIINPFVDQCSLSDKLRNVYTKNRKIVLITRSPLSENSARVRKSRKEYHEALSQSGVMIFYNNRIHCKIIVVDGILGVVSSMNFKSESSSGKSHEAGLVTWQKDVITSIGDYGLTLLKDHETKRFSG